MGLVMKLCSECKEPLNGIQAFTEEGQEDFPWCFRCLDYVDGIEGSANGFCERDINTRDEEN